MGLRLDRLKPRAGALSITCPEAAAGTQPTMIARAPAHCREWRPRGTEDHACAPVCPWRLPVQQSSSSLTTAPVSLSFLGLPFSSVMIVPMNIIDSTRSNCSCMARRMSLSLSPS
jgi:hypothetical protein